MDTLTHRRAGMVAGHPRQALALSPSQAMANDALGCILERKNRERDAIEHYQIAVRHAPEVRLFKDDLARIERKLMIQ